MNKKSTRSKRKSTKLKSLSGWEWETLVAAWRYFENRSTISSSMFPGEIVGRFFASGEWDEKSCHDIARQFYYVDHGIRGEEDWVDPIWKRSECDIIPWCKFFEFCKAWENGFAHLTLDDGKGDRREIEAFYCQYTKRWYPKDGYMANPFVEQYCEPKYIVGIEHVDEGGAK